MAHCERRCRLQEEARPFIRLSNFDIDAQYSAAIWNPLQSLRANTLRACNGHWTTGFIIVAFVTLYIYFYTDDSPCWKIFVLFPDFRWEAVVGAFPEYLNIRVPMSKLEDTSQDHSQDHLSKLQPRCSALLSPMLLSSATSDPPLTQELVIAAPQPR